MISAQVVDEATRSSYAGLSEAAANAEHATVEGAHLATVARRDIREGDEVLVSYGEGYWCSRAGLDASAPPQSGGTGKAKRARRSKASSSRPKAAPRGFG